jgi:hypothetical protein
MNRDTFQIYRNYQKNHLVVIDKQYKGLKEKYNNGKADLSNLIEGKTYHYRIKITFSGTYSIYGNDMTFTTLLPSATTNSATNVLSNSVKLNATINAYGSNVSVSFEYGTTTTYGQIATASPSSVSGTSNTNVTANLTGLTEGTSFHFRVKILYGNSKAITGMT